MQAQAIPVVELTADDLAAWQRLADAAVSPNPFFEPDFVLPAVDALEADDVNLLVVRDGSEWRAALPVRASASWRFVPGRCLASWTHLYCFLGTPLVAPPAANDALGLLVAEALRRRACLVLDQVDAAGPLAGPLRNALARQGRVVVLERFERASLGRREDGRYLEQVMNGHHRRELRRTMRRLSQAVGEVTFVDRTDDESAAEDFLRVEASGWKGRRGTALAAHEGHARMFREICSRFAARGRLELLSLQAGDRPVAMKCNLRAGHVTFCFKIGFDDDLSRFSPGIHLEAANLDYFHAGPARWSDSCAVPFNRMINRLWPGRRALQTAVVCRQGPSGALPFLRWKAAGATLLPAVRTLARRRHEHASRH
jgi:CelD/BcsL family acetyltransferase involved in cellulose biosynthesis